MIKKGKNQRRTSRKEGEVGGGGDGGEPCWEMIDGCPGPSRPELLGTN